MRNDPRINAKSMNFRNYLVIFLCMLFLCGSYAGLYFLQFRTNALIYIILSMFAYLVIISLAACFLFAFFRRHYLMRPVYRVCDAAQRVAAGDFSIRLSPLRKDGKKDEFELLFDDFNTMVEELASTEMLKNDFVSNVSHELKTPLAVIQNYATILQSEELSESERKEYAQRIGQAAERLSILVMNILQVNRLENQKIKPTCKPFNLSEALCRCILNYDAILEEKDIALDVDMDQGLILNSDENLLDMVWNNILSNAVKFTPEHGHIEIVLQRTGEFAVVSIADNGCGMDEGTLRHIFDKFYQGDTSHATQGNGLGLTLVKRIVDLLDGSICAESIPGERTVFHVKFKIIQEIGKRQTTDRPKFLNKALAEPQDKTEEN